MSATTPPKRQPTHHSGGGQYRKQYGWILTGGVVFLAAWLVWTFWFGAAIVG